MKGKWLPVVFASLLVLLTAGHGYAADKPIKIGFVYIMSGPAATYGQFAKQGAELAIDEINKAGGINGRKVEAAVRGRHREIGRGYSPHPQARL